MLFSTVISIVMEFKPSGNHLNLSMEGYYDITIDITVDNVQIYVKIINEEIIIF